jgi:hypothetical protein
VGQGSARALRSVSVLPFVNFRVNQPVAFLDLDGDDAATADIRVIGEIRFLNNTGLCGEHDMEIFVPSLIDSAWSRAGFAVKRAGCARLIIPRRWAREQFGAVRGLRNGNDLSLSLW